MNDELSITVTKQEHKELFAILRNEQDFLNVTINGIHFRAAPIDISIQDGARSNGIKIVCKMLKEL